ncbi:MAG: hypothetical protein K940chlam3_00733 [Chlamydiae bacterium]|nr:hypothetical protein [Chlamydiota bacterium]
MTSFWKKQPALLYGLALYLGIVLAIGHLWSLFPIFLIGTSLILGQEIRRFLLFALMLISAFGFIHMAIVLPPDTPIDGTAHIHISSIKPYRSRFNEGYIYQGTLKSFSSGHVVARNVPFSLKFPRKKNVTRPLANCDYIVQATLRKSDRGHVYLSVKKGTEWNAVPWTWSPAEWRMQNKMNVRQYINEKIPHQKSAPFLCGIATGLFDDNTLHVELSRFGLQHIMAISGFHFALVALLLSLGARCFLTEKSAASVVVILLTLYFIFLGVTPSILRAWIMATIFFMGTVLEKQSRPLNSLGIALIVVLTLDPLSVSTIGFQFTFLVTGSILLFYSPIESALRPLMKKRSLSQLVQMDLFNQHGYVVLNALRKILALTISVQIVAAPLILFLFQKFPLMSLIYNAFFPFLVSISIFLLLIGLFLSPVSPVANLIHAINSAYTEYVLNLAYQMPMSLDFWVRMESFSASLLVVYFCFVMTVGILMRGWMENRQMERRDLAFV